MRVYPKIYALRPKIRLPFQGDGSCRGLVPSVGINVSGRFRRLGVGLIKFYKVIFKRLFVTDAVCRFSPSCSEFAAQAVGQHGIVRGSWLALRRVWRCHPWSEGGPDPVPEQRERCQTSGISDV